MSEWSTGTTILIWTIIILVCVGTPILYRILNRSARYRALDRWSGLALAGLAVVLALVKFDGWPMFLLLLLGLAAAVAAVMVGDKQA